MGLDESRRLKPQSQIGAQWAWAVLLLGGLGLCSCATTPAGGGMARPLEITLNRGAGNGDPIFVTLRLNGNKDLLFVMDTGATGTFLDSSLAPELGKPLRQVKVTDNTTGQTKPVGLYQAPALSLGQSRLATGREVAVDDLNLLRRATGRPIMGILGMDCLSHYCIQLDFAGHKLRFLDPHLTNAADLGHVYKLIMFGGLPAVNMNLLGVRGFGTMVDTGDTSSGALWAELVKKAPGGSDRLVTNGIAVSFGGTHARVEGRFADCTFGEEKYDLVLTDDHTTSVGLSFLGRHLVTLDFPRRKMYLKRRENGRHPDPGSMVGLSIVRDGDETTVFTVDPKGPADLAGILPGDIVVAINGSLVKALEMWEIKSLIHADEGEDLVISVRRGDQEREIKVAVRQL